MNTFIQDVDAHKERQRRPMDGETQGRKPFHGEMEVDKKSWSENAVTLSNDYLRQVVFLASVS